MATIRYGSTAAGGPPIWTVPKPIDPVDLNAPPVPPMPTPTPPNVPVVTVEVFDGLITANGWNMIWKDGNGNITRIFTKNSGIYVEITNSAGKGATAKYRKVV